MSTVPTMMPPGAALDLGLTGAAQDLQQDTVDEVEKRKKSLSNMMGDPMSAARTLLGSAGGIPGIQGQVSGVMGGT